MMRPCAGEEMIVSPQFQLLGSYDPWLVLLSIALALLASFAALDLAGRVTAASGWMRCIWLSGGAVAMG
jgi:NO-binding membrane sensor protein with MHYT domain